MVVIIYPKRATSGNAVANQNKNKNNSRAFFKVQQKSLQKEGEKCEIMDSVPSTSKADDEKQLQVKLKTTQELFAVPDSTLSIPENVNPDKLNQLLKSLLVDKVESVPEFDFFLSDDLLRSTLGEFIKGSQNSLPKLLAKQ